MVHPELGFCRKVHGKRFRFKTAEIIVVQGGCLQGRTVGSRLGRRGGHQEGAGNSGEMKSVNQLSVDKGSRRAGQGPSERNV